MKLILVLLLVTTMSFAQETSYRDLSDVKMSTNYEMVVAQAPEKKAYSAKSIAYDTNPKLHLTVYLEIINISENDYLIRVNDAKGSIIQTRKAKKFRKIKLNFGEIDLAKVRKTNHLFSLFFLSKEKKVIDKIEFEVMESGALFVNGSPFKN